MVYTDPQIAWCGLTETEAKAEGRNVKVGRLPWAASDRSVYMGLREDLTKMIVDAESRNRARVVLNRVDLNQARIHAPDDGVLRGDDLVKSGLVDDRWVGQFREIVAERNPAGLQIRMDVGVLVVNVAVMADHIRFRKMEFRGRFIRRQGSVGGVAVAGSS